MLIQKVVGASDIVRWYLIRYRKFNKIKWLPVIVFTKLYSNKQQNLKPKYI